MPDAQPKPTPAEVIAAEEQRIQSFVDFDRHRDECVAEINGMRRALRILDAAGLLVTGEHDAQVRSQALVAAADTLDSADAYDELSRPTLRGTHWHEDSVAEAVGASGAITDWLRAIAAGGES